MARRSAVTGLAWALCILSVTLALAGVALAAVNGNGHIRDQVDLDTLSAELLAVVDRSMQPATASLWLRPSPADQARSGT